MEMIAHQAKCKYDDVKPQDNYRNIIHALDKIFMILEDIIFLQTVAGHMKITFTHILLNI